MQGRGGHSSPELGDKCRHRETNVKDCKRHAAQSWETNVKDCRAEQLGDKCEGLQVRGERGGTCKGKKEDKADTMTNKKGDNKGDKKGDEKKQKGDKTDTVPNKKGEKTGDKGSQKGDMRTQ